MNNTYGLSRFNNCYFFQSLSRVFHYILHLFFFLLFFFFLTKLWMCVCALSHVQLSDSMDCSPPGSPVRGILQARILEPVSISYSRGSSQPRDQTASLAPPALAGGFFTTSATWGYFNLKIWVCPLKNMFMYHPNTIFLSKNINSDSPIFSNPNSYLKFSICPRNAFSVQFSYSVMSNSCDPTDCSTPDFSVHYQLPEFAQTHVHRVSDAIQPFYPLSSPFPPSFNLSQHQGLF